MGKRHAVKYNKKLLIGLIVLTALVAAVLIEALGFNFKNITAENVDLKITEIKTAGFKKDEQGNLTAEQNNANITLKFDKKFIKNFKYDIGLVTVGDYQNPPKYEVQVNGKDLLRKYNSVYNNYFGIKEKTIVLNQETNEIFMSFSNMKDSAIKIDNYRVANYFQFNKVRFLIIFMFSLLILLIIFFRKLEIKMEIFTPIVIVSFGLLCSVLVPPHHTWDEFAHFIKSYDLAEGHVFPKNGVEREYPVGLEKLDYTANLEYQSYDDFLVVKQHLSDVSAEKKEKKAYNSTAIINLFVPYIPSGVGMKIAMIFKLPILYYLIFGRMMNVLLYALLAYLAVKKTPVCKNLMAFFAMLPINIFLAASLSCDFLATGCILLALAYTLDLLVNKKKASAKDIVLLFVLYTCITFAKVSYAPMFLFMFLLGKNQFSDKSKRRIYYGAVVIVTAVVAIGTYLYAQKLGIVQWPKDGVDSKLQVLGILKNPIGYLQMLFTFLADNSIHYIQNMFSFFAYLGNATPLVVLLTTGTTLFLSWFDLPNYPVNEFDGLSRIDKSILYVGSFGALGLSLTALYVSFTPVGQNAVQGFQGRYLLAILFPVLLAFRNKGVRSPFDKAFLERVVCVMIILVSMPLFQMMLTYFYNS
ncbi:DUF2142 domain-containing protein [Enterococcus sp. LJL51]|uniref:DUF2142 domain-containing protein n=1 Tax=Enterococcus sp. LJL51 TaxID=3416656 RepID=UPI003CF0654E